MVQGYSSSLCCRYPGRHSCLKTKYMKDSAFLALFTPEITAASTAHCLTDTREQSTYSQETTPACVLTCTTPGNLVGSSGLWSCGGRYAAVPCSGCSDTSAHSMPMIEDRQPCCAFSEGPILSPLAVVNTRPLPNSRDRCNDPFGPVPSVAGDPGG